MWDSPPLSTIVKLLNAYASYVLGPSHVQRGLTPEKHLEETADKTGKYLDVTRDTTGHDAVRSKEVSFQSPPYELCTAAVSLNRGVGIGSGNSS